MPASAGPPLRLRLPAIGVDAPLAPVGVSGGRLGVPDDVRVLGWWAQGVGPGSGGGTVVLDGHVDDARQGRGALYRLTETPVGAPVEVTTAGGSRRYVVRARRSYDKAALPQDVFRVDGAPRLVLITCGGPFSHAIGHYRDNVVVPATPVAAAGQQPG